ncbi:hypothetical protein BGX31_009786 [Mortierella sp. GBA43]|nr:hypothetical protein BGX31_009786 [Mortierella sp. GBA43]
MGSLSEVGGGDMSYAYSDFVAEVTVYVRELREATARAEIDRYQPIVANIISCVKALLIFTNTIARDSDVLQTYSELSKSRRTILRALGKLYSKCRVANGSQAMTTARQRQFAAEKLGIFAEQVLSGITEFTTRAREIGLRMATETIAAATTSTGELDMVLMASAGDIAVPSPPSSTSTAHSRPRRRVSRANSAKGYKSFNAVRQWKAEHQHKHNAAKQAVEQLLSEYMECLSEANGTTRLDRILSITIQTAQSVEIFIISADDMRSRANVKDDQDYAAYRAQLSATSNELYEYIKFLGPRGFSDEGILNKLMSLGTIMLRCLIDMEPHAPGSRRGSLAPIPEPVMPKIPSSMLMAASAMDSTANGQKDNHEPQFMESETPSKSRASRSPSRHRTNSNRKFGSISSLNERYKRQATGNGGQSSPDKEAAMSFLDSAYEGNEPEKKHVESHRPNQDSPVAVSSRVTQHQNIVAPQMGTVITVAIDEEAEDRRMESSEISGEPPKKSTVEQGRIPKGAERKIAAIIVPDMSQIKEEVVVPSPHSSRYRFEQDPDAPPTPSLRPQYTAHTSPSITGSRSPRMRASDSDSRAPSSRRRTSGRTDRTDRTDRLERTERVDRSERSERTDRYDRGDRSERRERPRSPAEFENSAISKDGDGIGLGVSVPAETRPKITSPSIGPSSGSSAVSRSSRAAGSSPNLEATRRTQRQEQPPRAHSPGPDLRPFSRNSNNSSTSLSPAGASSSRRGSQTSIRSEGSTGRRSNESQRVRDVDHQDRRHQAPRRGSGSASTLRVEQTKGDDVLAGLSTPSTPQVQSFVESSNSQRSGRHPHRESTQSNMSVATVSSVQSKGSGRPVSPPRSRNGQQDGSTKGRASIESIRGSDRHQHHPQSQQTKGPSSASGYRPRQNKVGQAKFPASGDDNRPEAPPAEPWFLEHDYESDEVLYNDNGTLIAATLDAYIEMLTSHKSQPEPMFMTTFFTTFRLFTDPLDLVQLLTRRFLKSPPSGLSEQDYAIWQQQKQERIQKRVHTAFKTWLEGYWVTDRDRAAFKPIMEFVKQEMMEVLPSSAGRLLEILNQWANKRKSLHSSARASTIGKSRSHDRISQVIQEQSSPHSPTSGSSISNAFSRPFATVKEKYSADQLKNAGKKGISPFSNRDSIQSRGPPVPLVNKALLSSLANEQTMTKVPITDIKPLELARQLTIMVGKLFLDIPYLELLGRERPNCSRMVQVSNKVTIWVTDTIVDEQDVKKRIGVVKHWIEVGEECLKLNNFDTLTAISCAIESTPVRRLHNTWEGISKTYVERAEQLRKMISSEFNYSVYRAKLKTVQSPCIPFLGLYFTVIAYIEDGNSIYKEINPQGTAPNSTSSTASTATTATNTTATTNTQQQQPNTPTPTPTRKLLRYGRFAQLARAVQEFRDFQGVYELLEVPRLRDYIMKCMENQDSERSYRKSLAIEPRRPAPGVIQPSPGSNMGPNSGNQRSNSSNKGLFQAISNSSDSSNGASGGIPNKLNKLSFFRKSTRVERI